MSDDAIAKLLQIEQQVRRCETMTELGFVMVNMTRTLVAYEQASCLIGTELETLKLTALSDTSLVDRSTPFCAWIEQVAKVTDGMPVTLNTHVLNSQQWRPELVNELNELSPPHVLWLPLLIPSKPTQRTGVLILAKSQIWTEREIGLLQHLAAVYAHAMQLFSVQSAWGIWLKRLRSRRYGIALFILLGVLSFVPVRLTVLAPAEIIANNPFLVTSAIAGAITDVLVKPGDQVNEGDVLVRLDKTEFEGAFNVAQREIERTQAELRTAEQAGYVDRRKKSELVELEYQVVLKTIERDFLQQKLTQTEIKSQQSGVAVLNDPEQWKGRPVVVGERIMSIADPANIQLEVMLPVQDAISLAKGNEVTFYLDTDPLNPTSFSVNYSSFEPAVTPDQIVAYRIVASPSEDKVPPRIGLRGTAKLYGEQVSLAYYLFRRPITFVRQNLGF